MSWIDGKGRQRTRNNTAEFLTFVWQNSEQSIEARYKNETLDTKANRFAEPIAPSLLASAIDFFIIIW
jgi:hypothetical protein